MSYTAVAATKYTSSGSEATSDNVVVEEILNIAINQEPYTMTMRTPDHEEALTRGILLSEQVYSETTNPIFSIDAINEKGLITHVNVSIPPEHLGKGILNKRNLISVSSCGMCGKSEMELALEGDKLKATADYTTHQIQTMFETMKSQQLLFSHTGGSHAAALFDVNGNLLCTMEDIGRHNAVDKAIGVLLLHQKLIHAHALLVSGRVSYEIVSKCFMAGIPVLASVSAPSSLAIEYSLSCGISLLAFCRNGQYTKYS